MMMFYSDGLLQPMNLQLGAPDRIFALAASICAFCDVLF